MGKTFTNDDPNENKKHENRKITFSSEAFGIFREDLIKNIGLERVKGFLVRFGWNLGVADANEAKENELSLMKNLKSGPSFHSLNGHITRFEIEEIIVKEDKSDFFYRGKWIDSFEAEEHVKQFGLSEKSLCHTLIGYASGYLSTIINQKVVGREVTCVGKGDDNCVFEMVLASSGDESFQKELPYYKENPIVKELDTTFEQLIEQKSHLQKISDFHHQITESVTKGSDLQDITDIVYNLIETPVTIESVNSSMSTFSGMDEFMYLQFNKELMNELSNINERQWPEKVDCFTHHRLIVPIVLQKAVIGYCTFIYSNQEKVNIEQDFSILEGLSTTAALILLNEKTKIETLDRMKGFLLEQILDKQITTQEEFISRASLINVNVETPYIIVNLWNSNKKRNLLKLNQEIFEKVSFYFTNKNRQVLITHREDSFVLLIQVESSDRKKVIHTLSNFLKYMKREVANTTFKLGVSHTDDEISNVIKLHNEAKVAIRRNLKEEICFFEDLGILGVLINSNDESAIMSIASRELGSLFHSTNLKKQEYLQTLYVFLQNGGRIEQTMENLSLSKSGLFYRIKRIEEIIEKDLRDPKESYQLLLLLESLLSIGKIQF